MRYPNPIRANEADLESAFLPPIALGELPDLMWGKSWNAQVEAAALWQAAGGNKFDGGDPGDSEAKGSPRHEIIRLHGEARDDGGPAPAPMPPLKRRAPALIAIK